MVGAAPRNLTCDDARLAPRVSGRWFVWPLRPMCQMAVVVGVASLVALVALVASVAQACVAGVADARAERRLCVRHHLVAAARRESPDSNIFEDIPYMNQDRMLNLIG